ncbi:hypothetical protein CICLE_v10023960mg [Citrus x clementina]|uniref:Uncharacterized protein n=1 Tax=Citrus clementina TaxID=85681 RepID=V4TNV9_CITCL|nr:hypothetical protein CICLE_v10023960mg [Citrus x clementina]
MEKKGVIECTHNSIERRRRLLMTALPSCGQCTQELRICFDVFSNHDIDNWIKFALERRV